MNIVILLAAGKSQRAKQNKLWAKVQGKPFWTLAYNTLQSHPEIDQIVLVVPKGETRNFGEFTDPKTEIVEGGETRMSSFLNGLKSIYIDHASIILDHNAANPNLTSEEISAVIAAAKEHGAAAVSMPAVDTLITEKDGFYAEKLDRSSVRYMQTPQAVRADILKELSLEDAGDLTSALLEHCTVKLVEAHPSNKKITYAEDIEALAVRSYLGEDSHSFSNEGTLKLGGLEVPGLPSLEANSDGDVVLHAIGRALAQAQGKSFSKIADELCEAGEKDSAAYLRPLLESARIQNLSLHIEAKQPHIDNLPLRSSLAKTLGIEEEKISISAMSGEELSPFGRGEAIRCSCILQCS